MSKSDKEKLKILCLHGYRQSGPAFKSKLGSLRKQLIKLVEFDFVTAPHTVPDDPTTCPQSDEQSSGSGGSTDKKSDTDQYGWWFNKRTDDGRLSFKGTNQNEVAYGFDVSLQLIENYWKENGPFDGLLGFSQGACLAALICFLHERGLTSVHPKFVILAAGFCSKSLAHTSLYSQSVTIPSLHIYGQTDDIISDEMSEMLMERFDEPKVVKHTGGHYLPASSQYKHFYREFIEEHLERIKEP